MISVKDVSFSYTKSPFIDGITFDVEKGEIFGFLGPSGAGKSTLQKIMIGLLLNYKGSVKVNDREVKLHDNSFYENIGIDFEFPSLFEKLTARENLRYFAMLYKNKGNDIDTLLKKLGLFNDADKKVSDYSKGMKSRLNFAKSLINNPDILFLDEPTSGLDPTNSRIMKDIILEQQSEGKTIIITTHNMQDATELCTRVAFIVDGKVKALDTPHNLIMQKGANKIKYSYIEDNREICRECLLDETGNDMQLLKIINEGKLYTIHSSEPDLGDIFMDITGRVLA